jgi:hypothetical protein
MAVNKVDLYVSQIKELLDQGYTWLEKDNLGYGSIETKYGANAVQIAAIRKHPKLKDLETNITIFNVIDDCDETTDKTKRSASTRSTAPVEQPMVSVDTRKTSVESNDAANIFANL